VNRPKPAVGQVIYLIQFDSGLLKIGRTISWERRFEAHAGDGSTVLDYALIAIDEDQDIVAAEMAALEAARSKLQVVQGREWFFGEVFAALPLVLAGLRERGIKHQSASGGIFHKITAPSAMAPGDIGKWIQFTRVGRGAAATLLGLTREQLASFDVAGAPGYVGLACVMDAAACI